mgnify:CR=1 FL=1
MSPSTTWARGPGETTRRRGPGPLSGACGSRSARRAGRGAESQRAASEARSTRWRPAPSSRPARTWTGARLPRRFSGAAGRFSRAHWLHGYCRRTGRVVRVGEPVERSVTEVEAGLREPAPIAPAKEDALPRMWEPGVRAPRRHGPAGRERQPGAAGLVISRERGGGRQAVGTRRDRFTSAARSVEFRTEIGSTAARWRPDPRLDRRIRTEPAGGRRGARSPVARCRAHHSCSPSWSYLLAPGRTRLGAVVPSRSWS